MRAPRTITIAVVAVFAFSAACSTESGQQIQTSDERESTTTTAMPPSSTTSTAAPTRRAPTTEENPALSNLNERDGGIGTLCWARWEIARLYLQATAIFASEPERAAKAATELAVTLPQVLEPVRNARVEDAAVASFRDEFASSLATASSQVNSTSAPSDITAVATEQFNFDAYPGINEYVAAASAASSCSNP
jgi:hypothetical protein